MVDRPNKITELRIKCFRGFENQKLALGDAVTVIFGKNGTSKSTLLGMIAQPFYFSSKKQTKYTSDYDVDKGGEISAVQINGKTFETKYSDIFRMSETDELAHEKRKYEYYLKITGENVRFSAAISGHDDMLLVQSQFAREDAQKRRFRLVGGGPSHKRGAGNFPHPVIYLGLSRLYPMALSTLDENKVIDISKEEEQWFDEQYRSVLSLPKQQDSLSVSCPRQINKSPYLLPNVRECNYKSASAGQDNVGQIISAVLSFRRLKLQMAEEYKGGMLLIDELGASLHPSAQKNLLRFLCSSAKELSIQVIATSHSLVVLRESFYSRYAEHIRVVQVIRAYNSPRCKIRSISDGVGFSSIKKDFFNEYESEIDKLPVLLEDNAARHFLQRILEGDMERNCFLTGSGDNKQDTSSHSYLEWLMSFSPVNTKLPFVYVFDGDVDLVSADNKRAVFLPGKTYPEKVLYDFYQHEYDWDENPAGFDFSGEACFEGYREADVSLSGFSSEKQMHKSWYKSVSKQGRFGKDCALGYKYFLKANKEEHGRFKLSFVKAANEALRNTSTEYADVKRFFALKEQELEAEMKSKASRKMENARVKGMPPEGRQVEEEVLEKEKQMLFELWSEN